MPVLCWKETTEYLKVSWLPNNDCPVCRFDLFLFLTLPLSGCGLYRLRRRSLPRGRDSIDIRVPSIEKVILVISRWCIGSRCRRVGLWCGLHCRSHWALGGHEDVTHISVGSHQSHLWLLHPRIMGVTNEVPHEKRQPWEYWPCEGWVCGGWGVGSCLALTAMWGE